MKKSSTPYRKLCTEYYDLDKPKASEESIQFYLQYAAKANGPILEPMCGTGNYLIPMMEKGYEVTGFDTSLDMLNICKKKCQLLRLEPTVHHASFETVSLSNSYSLVFILSSSISLLTTNEKLKQALSLVHEKLQPNGKFVFDVETQAAVQPSQGIWKSSWKDALDGSKLVLNTASRFDPKTSIETVLCRYELWEANQIIKTEVEDFQLRLFSLSEMEEMLDQAGFETSHATVPYSEKIADDKDPTILFECAKKQRLTRRKRTT